MASPIVYNPEPGHRFGYWMVVDAGAQKIGRRHVRMCLCRCDCGTVRNVVTGDLCTGKSKSCGCMPRTKGYARTHGMYGTKTYSIWQGIKRRCLNPTNQAYPHYGGRGISMHANWAASFEAFLKDMGECPSDEHSIERLDVNGHYEPGNCVWLPLRLQARNQRNTRLSVAALSDIAKRRAQGESYRAIGEALGCSSSTVRVAHLRINWADVAHA